MKLFEVLSNETHMDKKGLNEMKFEKKPNKVVVRNSAKERVYQSICAPPFSNVLMLMNILNNLA